MEHDKRPDSWSKLPVPGKQYDVSLRMLFDGVEHHPLRFELVVASIPFQVFEAVMTAAGYSYSKMDDASIKMIVIEFRSNIMSDAEIEPFKNVFRDTEKYIKERFDERSGLQYAITETSLTITRRGATTEATAVMQAAHS